MLALFEWVIENLCKNAIDALSGEGEIEIALTDYTQVVYVDIRDTGKGIPKSHVPGDFHTRDLRPRKKDGVWDYHLPRGLLKNITMAKYLFTNRK